MWPFLDVLELAPLTLVLDSCCPYQQAWPEKKGRSATAWMDEAQPDQGNYVIISYSTNKDNGGTLKEAPAHSSSGATCIMRTFPAIQEAEG